ncbi:arylamine N-acetyltransferase family protein [Streptosporangium saharense]|uniref:arylamine N-acetyltransferase family protein n=1 Tax=Streptosporangium saharense TaxID=1706840 RepID=UPI00331B34B9
MESIETDEYLTRIGAARPHHPDAEVLADLHLRHLRTVPFENLSIHLAEPIVLDEAALIDKIVTRRRGGFCYELNGAFAVLLRSLGYRVTMLAARSLDGGSVGPPFDHMALRVDAPDPWLVDVGFGRFVHRPLRLDPDIDQADPEGVFRLVETEEGDIDVLKDGVPQYRLEQRPRLLADYEATCWWQQTSPTSHFTRSLVCSRLTEDGRLTLSGRQLVHTVGQERRETTLTTDAEVLAAYRDHFGIELDTVPSLGIMP